MNCWLLMLPLPQVVDVVRNFFKAEAAVAFLDGVVVLAVEEISDYIDHLWESQHQ